MSINEFVEMTIFLCLICFSSYDKMQSFIHESGLAEIKMAAKSGGEMFLRKVTSRLHRFPADQKCRRNRSVSLRFRDKRVFAFNAEIQDGCQKWMENNFCEKSPVNSENTLRIKNFIEIALSHTISEINVFLCFQHCV